MYPQSNTFAENGVKSAKALLRKCISGKKIDYEEWDKGLLSIRNTPNKHGLSPAMIVYGHMVKYTLPAHKKALEKSWHKEMSDFDKKVARERQSVEKLNINERELKPLRVGDPVVVQNRNNKRWDKYAIIQEVNLQTRKYLVRLSSGLLTVRNRRDLRKRFPPKTVSKSGTSEWSPFPQQTSTENEEDEDSDEEDSPPIVTGGRLPMVQPQLLSPPVNPVNPVNPVSPDPAQKLKLRPTVRFTEPVPETPVSSSRRPVRSNRNNLPSHMKDYVVSRR